MRPSRHEMTRTPGGFGERRFPGRLDVQGFKVELCSLP